MRAKGPAFAGPFCIRAKASQAACMVGLRNFQYFSSVGISQKTADSTEAVEVAQVGTGREQERKGTPEPQLRRFLHVRFQHQRQRPVYRA